MGFATIISYTAFAVACVVTEQVHAFADGGMLPSRRRRNFNKTELFCYQCWACVCSFGHGGDVGHGIGLLLLVSQIVAQCDQVGKACICNDRNGV